jgi:hypothetical protein
MEPPEKQRRNARFPSIAFSVGFVIVVQLAALYFTQVNAPVTSQLGYSYAPAGTSSVGAASNALLLVVAVFATTLLAVWLVRNKRVKVFKLIVFMGAAFALFLLTLLTVAILTSGILDETIGLYISVGAGAVVVAILVLSTFARRAGFLTPVVTGLLSAEVGSYFASTVPYLTAILIPIAFSIYDIYAVFRGPLKQLITLASEDSLGSVSTKVGELTIGVGDTVFYSMIPSIVLFQFSLGYAFLTMAAIDIGVVVTLFLLTRVKLLPGLPIPMALGLLTVLLYTVR